MLHFSLKIAKIAFLVLLLFPHFSFAQGMIKEKADLPLYNTVVKDFLPDDSVGCAIMIVKQGKVAYKSAIGKADIGLNVPLRSDMLFEIGSISKQFAAVAILQLVEQNKIRLDQNIKDFFPDYPTQKYVITIENLLTHTSGITDDVKEFDENKLDFWKFSQQETINFFKNIPLKFEPATQTSYSNPAYLLLGYIIEKVTGKSYENYIKENIFKPCDMQTAYVYHFGEIIPNQVRGYERNEQNKIVNARPDYIDNKPAGGLIMSIDDYWKWHRALFSYQIIKKETLAKAITPFKLKDGKTTSFGYGFEIDNAFGVPIVYHGGRTFGFNTQAMYAPKEDVLVLVFNNQSMANLTSMTTILLHLAVDKKYNFSQILVEENVLDKYVGKYKWNEITDQHVVIYKKNGKLFFKDSYSPQPCEMRFTTKNSFFMYDFGFMMTNTFLEDANGKITGFRVSGNNEKFDAKKVE
ncbi:MAG: class A beta-lactamase-related serine hydrolase [Bacteroidetes bacterium]|nr:MAG: class A beta-lactamase-related serine hydrolase [Bacteroidota bacterium]TAG89586.1 MAG: class A beta-lactamase-related serine hydrolase [Bacteroidota bacterium]